MERPFRSVAPQRPRWNTRRCRWTLRIVCPHWARSSRYVDNVEKFCRRVSVDVRFALRGAPRAAKLLPHADRADPKPKDHGSIAGQGRASQQKRTSHVRFGSEAACRHVDHVCFAPRSGHARPRLDTSALCQSRLNAPQQQHVIRSPRQRAAGSPSTARCRLPWPSSDLPPARTLSVARWANRRAWPPVLSGRRTRRRARIAP